MTPLTEIGECLISTKKHDYLFRPSFAAMTRIGSPEEIVQAFYDVHDNSDEQVIYSELSRQLCGNSAFSGLYKEISGKDDNPLWILDRIPKVRRKAFMAAVSVIQACCEDDCSELTGEMIPSRRRSDGVVWRSGLLPFSDIIVIASSLITHGIIGKVKTRQLQRNEGKAAATEFLAIEYINSARTHFGMTREEAERLTMTEFTMLINAKYPPEKGFTRDEYDAVMDEDERKWQEMLDKQGR